LQANGHSNPTGPSSSQYQEPGSTHLNDAIGDRTTTIDLRQNGAIGEHVELIGGVEKRIIAVVD
jgi:hypothetical protein